MREALVFIQFAISIGVIACTLLMGQQMRYIANKGLGFDKENRVLLTLRGRDLVEREIAHRDRARETSGRPRRRDERIDHGPRHDHR